MSVRFTESVVEDAAFAWLVDFETPGQQRLARRQPVHGVCRSVCAAAGLVLFVNG